MYLNVFCQFFNKKLIAFQDAEGSVNFLYNIAPVVSREIELLRLPAMIAHF